MNQFVNHLSCTALLVGKKASVDGSTMIARNEDAAGGINPKRFIVVKPDEQPQRYVSTFNGFQLDLPQNPLQIPVPQLPTRAMVLGVRPGLTAKMLP